MSSICTQGIKGAEEEAPLLLKILWGSIIGIISVIFLATFGVDGIKMLSYLGGFPAIILGILSLISLFLIMGGHEKLSIVAKD